MKMDRKWRGKSYGGKFGTSCFATLLRIGMFPAYILLIFVAAFFVLRRRKALEGSAKYLELKRRAIFPEIFKLAYSFGICMLDKTAYMSGSKKIKCEDGNVRNTALKILAKNNGVLFLTAHVGGWEMAGSKLTEYKRETAAIGELEEDSEVESAIKPSRKIPKMKMSSNPSDTLGLVEAFGVLRRGGVAAAHGDRYAGGRFAKINFLGKPAKMPLSPYILAAKAKCAVIPVVCLRKKLFFYEVEAGDPMYPKNTADAEKGAEMFAKFLEEKLDKYPYQWFNFYDYWD